MMARGYNNGIETEENLEKFKRFCRVQSEVRGKEVKPTFQNWLVWRRISKDRKWIVDRGRSSLKYGFSNKMAESFK